MWFGLVVTFEYTQAFFILIYYWIKALGRVLFVHDVEKNVENETILVTGAGSGLGRGVAKRLAALGATVVLWDVNEKGNEDTKRQILDSWSSAKVYSMKVNLCDREDIYRAAKQVKDQVGDVTIVINNAGVVSGKSLLDIDDASIQRTFDVNIIAHFWVLKSFLGSMLAANRGHIVTIASGAGIFGISKLTDYCSSKYAAVGLHDALTAELKQQHKYGIQTTVICPTFINTGMFHGVSGTATSVSLLDENYVCDSIVEAIRKNKHFVMLPPSTTLFYILKGLLPNECTGRFLRFFGLSNAMDTFVGRK
ncbi:unnamed protein product [Rotaria socialis]|uniref:Short-chain dehydrogenase/reductase 3 n=1 Tax=Rotaria socialis TaxID=392032 RepID=A0A818CX41_9BILA|nr:unnamed protein product [Rotaria socialis]CAF3434702.1 unnamed protein product [Rotaria socialis]CAF3557368.1 unnamed protein product [Rotaria socialis]CAF4285025.1 unnamed protein product [Rotaria socialis]CAF4418252.1 unnamed protein product [Rotaria socialis]